jgi:hypothetical protein
MLTTFLDLVQSHTGVFRAPGSFRYELSLNQGVALEDDHVLPQPQAMCKDGLKHAGKSKLTVSFGIPQTSPLICYVCFIRQLNIMEPQWITQKAIKRFKVLWAVLGMVLGTKHIFSDIICLNV